MPKLQDIRGRLRKSSVGTHDDLDAAVLFIAESLVSLWPLFQRYPRGDQEGQIDFALYDALQQWSQIVLNVGLTRLKGQCLTDKRSHCDRHDVDEDAGQRDRAL